MLKVFKYLKPYTIFVIICTLLLFLQANMELMLPDYMSRIVNIGIQQGGVSSPVPEMIRKSELDKLLPFLDTEPAAAILAGYTLLSPAAPDYQTYLEKYPVAGTQAVYVLTEKGRENRAALAPYMSQGLMILAATAQFNVGVQMKDMVMAKILAMDKKQLEQAALRAVKVEYEALGMDTAANQTRYILTTGLAMILLTLVAVVATILVGLIASMVAAKVAQRVRSDVFKKVESFSGQEFDKFSTASLITRSTNDITQIQMLILMMLRLVLYAPILGIGGVFRAFGKAPSMSWLIGLAVFVLLCLIISVVSVAMPRFKMNQKLIDRLNLVARENLSGLLVVRAFNRQKFEEQRFDDSNKELTAVSLFINRVMVVMMPVMMLVLNVLSVSIIWVGAKQVAASSLQVGDMMAFLQYAMQIVMSFFMLSMMFIILPRAAVSGTRIAEVLNTEPAVKDPEAPAALPAQVRGEIEFRNVCFRYPGAEADALHDISFTAKPGQTTAIIGSTGSGKSTAINLIPRFYDTCSGKILLDGMDIRMLRQQDLRNQVGYVPQKITLFSGTIASNLRYGDESATDEALQAAAETSQAMEFIQAKPEGFVDPIAQQGSNVSGGQKQRLSIARALVKKFPVYIFDDSFSALDFRTDAALRRAMKQKTGESTLIIVAQRVSTIMQAEQIIVLDEGRIVGKGTHKELMASCQEYKEIVLSQLDIKEIA